MKTNERINDDKVLFAALKKGNKKAFTLLYEKYWEKLYYVAYQHTQSTEESEDLIHEVFIDLWKKRKKIKIEKTVSSYIFTALKYKIFRLYDKKSVRKKYNDRIKHNGSVSLNVTEMELSFNELYNLIEHEIEKLPERCKLIFKIRRMEDYSIEEVAKKLEISSNTVNNQMTKASKILKVKIGEYLNTTFF
jgi:RNA polymerase sigma-70 factor (ECF subfamily)